MEGHGRRGRNQMIHQLTGPKSGCHMTKLFEMSGYIVLDMTPIGARRAIWASMILQMRYSVLFSIVRPFLKRLRYVHFIFILSTMDPKFHIILFDFRSCSSSSRSQCLRGAGGRRINHVLILLFVRTLSLEVNYSSFIRLPLCLSAIVWGDSS